MKALMFEIKLCEEKFVQLEDVDGILDLRVIGTLKYSLESVV